MVFFTHKYIKCTILIDSLIVLSTIGRYILNLLSTLFLIMNISYLFYQHTCSLSSPLKIQLVTLYNVTFSLFLQRVFSLYYTLKLFTGYSPLLNCIKIIQFSPNMAQTCIFVCPFLVSALKFSTVRKAPYQKSPDLNSRLCVCTTFSLLVSLW